ncbi:MAG: D-cysteine desulfhydrase [Thermonema sp.]|nr:MAG: D-cysteine desulfhydrase [Thermonema sp.]
MPPLQKVNLGFFPTPLHPLKRIGKNLPYELWIKRDDQTGLATGGNKCRKLEYLLAEALAQGADTVLTAGAQQSNHCRQTAAACAALGLECHLMLGGVPPAVETGNLKLSRLLGAHIHFTGQNRKGEALPALYRRLQDAGKRCYVIPYGGSNALGACGFVEAMAELKEQTAQLALSFDYIFFASSSGGTQAGMMVGSALYRLPARLMPVRIDKEPVEGAALQKKVNDLVAALAPLWGIQADNIPPCPLLTDYDAAGYAVLTPQEQRLMEEVARTEGILLDPVYTARAFYAMYDHMKKKQLPEGSRVLFWHTGGIPALWAY